MLNHQKNLRQNPSTSMARRAFITTDGNVPRFVKMIADDTGEFTNIGLDLGGSEGNLPRKGPAVLIGSRVGDTFHVFQATVTDVAPGVDMAGRSADGSSMQP